MLHNILLFCLLTGLRSGEACGLLAEDVISKGNLGRFVRVTEDIIALTRDYGRYGYRMIAGMLNNSGWHVNHKRVERIWRREGLKVPHKQKRKGRLWMNPLGALLRNTLPGNGRIMCAASSRATKSCLVV